MVLEARHHHPTDNEGIMRMWRGSLPGLQSHDGS